MYIPRIVLDGGPCGGKSTALSAISAHCQELGYTPIVLPEAATHLISSGFNPTHSRFQRYVLKELIHAEQLRLEAVKAGDFVNPVFIYDRGGASGLAYVPSATFNIILNELNLTIENVRDQYTGVIFLDSSAVGAESFYTTANNMARRESLAEARILNTRTLDAWMGTPRLEHIKNLTGESFKDKITRCLKAVDRFLDKTDHLEQERKFIVTDLRLRNLPKNTVQVNVIQTYLVGNEIEERVRARGQGDNFLYFHTCKTRVDNGIAREVSRLIDYNEYQRLLIRADPGRLSIHKTRHCFMHGGRYCELDVFHGHREGSAQLEIEVSDIYDMIILPTHLGNLREVTGNSQYLNYQLALPD